MNNLNYAEQAKIISEKKQVKEVSQQRTSNISPTPTPSTPTTEAKKKGQGRE